jgi:transcription antitermination factor NusB
MSETLTINVKPTKTLELKGPESSEFKKTVKRVKNEIADVKEERVVKPFNSKTGSRFVAVQALYSLMVDERQNSNDCLLNATEYFKEKFSKRINANFARELLEKSLAEKDSIDFIFKNYLEKLKEVELVNPLIRAIISVALCELLMSDAMNKKIIISEYVKISSSFFNKKEVGFVNALLDKFVKDNQN